MALYQQRNIGRIVKVAAKCKLWKNENSTAGHFCTHVLMGCSKRQINSKMEPFPPLFGCVKWPSGKRKRSWYITLQSTRFYEVLGDPTGHGVLENECVVYFCSWITSKLMTHDFFSSNFSCLVYVVNCFDCRWSAPLYGNFSSATGIFLVHQMSKRIQIDVYYLTTSILHVLLYARWHTIISFFLQKALFQKQPMPIPEPPACWCCGRGSLTKGGRRSGRSAGPDL